MEFEDDEIEPFPVDGMSVPLIRLTEGGPPKIEIKVGERPFRYDRSYPIKGHSAVLPPYLREQMGAGKEPLLLERPDRFYLYFAA